MKKVAIEINKDECTACEACVIECPNDVLKIEDEVAVVNSAADCDDCGKYIDVCPNDAISKA